MWMNAEMVAATVLTVVFCCSFLFFLLMGCIQKICQWNNNLPKNYSHPNLALQCITCDSLHACSRLTRDLGVEKTTLYSIGWDPENQKQEPLKHISTWYSYMEDHAFLQWGTYITKPESMRLCCTSQRHIWSLCACHKTILFYTASLLIIRFKNISQVNINWNQCCHNCYFLTLNHANKKIKLHLWRKKICWKADWLLSYTVGSISLLLLLYWGFMISPFICTQEACLFLLCCLWISMFLSMKTRMFFASQFFKKWHIMNCRPWEIAIWTTAL